MTKFFHKLAVVLLLITLVIAYITNSKPAPKDRIELLLAQKAAAEKHEEGENPGLLHEALAQLKTTRDGKTYPHNYRLKALEKALKEKRDKRIIPGVDGIQNTPVQWKEIGPGNVSGRARAVIVDPSDPAGNTWFAATIGGGIWKTTNSGATWENKTPGLLTLTTTTLAIAQSDPDVMYAGTGMGYGRIVDLPGSGIWKSTDGGDNWNQLQSTANGELLAAINRIIVDPNDPNIVLACSNGFNSHLGPKAEVNGPYGVDRLSGIFKSTDGGNTWNQVFDPDAQLGNTTDNRVQQLLADPTDFNTIYATVNEVGIIKSTDAGQNWTVITNNFVLPNNIGVPGVAGFGLEGVSTRTEMAIAPTDPNRLYAAVERPSGQIPKFFMSTDAGATWIDVQDTGSNPSWFSTFGNPGRNSAWFNNTILVSPYDPNVVFVGGVNTFRIDVNLANNTRTTVPINWWIPNTSNIPVVHADHHWIASIPIDESTNTFRLIMANDGGVAYSDDSGVTWTQTSGMITTQFYGVDKKPGENIYVGGLQDNGTWMSPENPETLSNWREVGGGDGVEVAWHANDPDQIIIGSQNGNLRKSKDGGQTFFQIPDARAGFGPFISKVANTKTDPDMVFTVGQLGVRRSDDFGDTWSHTQISGNWIGDRPFDNVEVHHADPRVVYISSRMAFDQPRGIQGGIHVSKDGGLTFTEISGNFPESVVEASGIATDPTSDRIAYFLFSAPGQPKILKTFNHGESFTDFSGFDINSISTGFPDVGVFSLLVMPFNPRILWAGTEIGLFVSEDGGITWSIDDTFPHVAVFQMSIVDDQVIVATQGRGVWTTTLPELVDFVPPSTTLIPRIETLAMTPQENRYKLAVSLKSPYDSAHVISNGQIIERVDANNTPEILRTDFAIISEETIQAKVIGFKDGEAYESGTKSLTVFPVEEVNSYASRLNLPTNNQDFVLRGFRVGLDPGFSNSNLGNSHPYAVGSESIAMLKKAIVVANENAFMNFQEIVLVEPGVSDNFLDPNFFDFVIVEATTDGENWLPLLDGYDSRINADWLSAYNSGLSGINSTTLGNEALFRESTQIDLLDTFNPGDKIFIRFRLVSDASAVGWGWAIDDLQIQDIISGFDEQVEKGDLAVRSYPNPAKSQSTIEYYLPGTSKVILRMIDAKGNVVNTVDLGHKSEGIHEQGLDLQNQRNGLYIIAMETVFGVTQTKLIKEE